MFQDVLYGLRTMAKSPGVTAVAVITLALGIGANTAMFSVMDAVLLRPLAYRDPDRLVTILAQLPSRNIFGAFIEYNTYGEWWKARSQSFESMAAYTPGSINLTSGSEPERLLVYRVNAGFTGMAGLRPLAGRDFLPEEDRPDGPKVAILAHRLWQRRFAGDRALIGRQISLDRASYTVVGILPPEFDLYGDEVDAYLPIAASTARAPGMPSVGVHARLKPGVTLARAQAEIDSLCRAWVDQYHYPNDWGARVWRVRDYAVRTVRSSVIVMGVAVALVLLIACANVANLLLARAGARQREMAIRCALGASRWRVVRQLLTESALLGMAGALLGLATAWAGVRALAAAKPYLPFQKSAAVDGRVLAFTLAAAVATVLLFGLAPALAAVRPGVAANLKEGVRGGGEGIRTSRFRGVLVAGEVALALLLAIGASLMMRSMARLSAVDPGFRSDHVWKGFVTLRGENYTEPVKRVNFYRALTAKAAAIPGVTGVGLTSHLPFGHSKTGSNVAIEGAPPPKPGEATIVFSRTVDTGYFPALQVRLARGRFFDEHDPPGHPVAIINEAFARKGWGSQDPVGKRFGDGRPDHWMTVVGVIHNLRQDSLDQDPDPESYMPYTQTPGPTMALVVRSAGDPERLAPAIRKAVREIDKELPLADVGLLAENVAQSTRSRRFSTWVLGGFAALALLLAAVGIYGVISYSVARRTHEIGVRMALGAERGRIAAAVVGRALLLAAIGVVLGVAGAIALTRLLRSMLFGVSPTDPLTFAGASLFLLAVAALAGYIPARRAAGIDPGIALREE